MPCRRGIFHLKLISSMAKRKSAGKVEAEICSLPVTSLVIRYQTDRFSSASNSSEPSISALSWISFIASSGVTSFTGNQRALGCGAVQNALHGRPVRRVTPWALPKMKVIENRQRETPMRADLSILCIAKNPAPPPITLGRPGPFMGQVRQEVSMVPEQSFSSRSQEANGPNRYFIPSTPRPKTPPLWEA